MSSGPNKNNRNKNLLAAKHALGLATGSVGSSHTARSTHTNNTVYTSHSRASTSTSGRFSESKSGGGGGVSTASGSASAASRSTVGTAGSSGIFTLAPSASGRYNDITERFGSKSTGQTAASTVTATSASAISSGAASKSSRLSQIHDLSAAARQHARRFSESSGNLSTEERMRPRGVGGARSRFLAGSTGQHTANTGVSSLSASMHSDVDDVNSINNNHNRDNNNRRRGSHTSLSVDQLIYLEEEESHDDSMMGIRATAIGRGASSVSTARERRASLNSVNNVSGSSQSASHDTSLNISNMNSSSNMNIHNMGRKNTEHSSDSILNNVMEKSSSLNNVYEKKVSFHEGDLAASTAGSSIGGRRSMSDALSDADTFGDSSVALVSYSGREIGNLEDELNDDDFSEVDIANKNGNQNRMENDSAKNDDEENNYNESNLSKSRASVEEDEFTTNDGESSQFSQSQQLSQYSESQQYSQYSESQQYSQYSQSQVSQESQPQYSQSHESQSQSQSQSQQYGDSPHDHSQSILSNTDTYSTFSSNASDTFVPQRFEEMRSLLLGITPLQLEALMMEIFGDDTPVGWKGIGQGGVPPGRSRRNNNPDRRFRKDAYLSEMTLEELMHFSHGMNLVGIESCETHEDAMDLIAIEFERLVSVHQNRPEEGGADGSSATASEYTDQSGSQFSRKRKQLRNASSSSFSEKDASSYNSAGSSIVDDEGENLRRSLRACSVPELRLVAERLQLDHSQCGNKEELISLIESSMPGMLGRAGVGSGNQGSVQGSIMSSSSRGDESSAGYYLLQEQQPQPQSQQYRQQPQQQQIQLYEPNQDNSHERNRKVSFAKDCKADTSHLVEPRDMSKQTAWQSFVVTGDVEHGEESESKNLMPSDGSGDEDDDWINPEKSSNESDTTKKRKRFLGLFAVLCIIGLGVGLGVGLTKKSDGASGSNLIIPDSGYFDFPYRPTAKPTLMPSTIVDTEEEVEKEEEPEPGEAGSNVAVVIVREPTSSAPTTILTPTPEPTIAAMETNPPTLPPFTSDPTATLVVPTTPIPTENFGPIPTPPPSLPPTITANAQTSQPTPGPSTYVDPSPPPTPLSPYPLLGPFDEVGMRIVLYGVGELSNMGRTQWHMLTAAYIEQFFNVEGQGVDAIQNIVFDVVCNIEISDQELLSVSSEGAYGRSLQDSSVILTFTTTISYRTFSESLTPDTVAERPFLDENMRLGYVQFLSQNNAAQFVGDVLGVSAIFRGDDVPETPSEFLPSVNNTPPPVTSAPTGHPTEVFVETVTPDPTPPPTPVEIHATETPITQEPSRAATKSPSLKPNPSPTPRPTEYPTQNSFDIPNPITPAPTQAKLSTPYPTTSAPSQVNLPTPYPVSRPSGAALSTPYPTQNALFGPINSFPPTANKMFDTDLTFPPTQYRLFVPADASVSPAPSAAPVVSAAISRPRPRPVPLTTPTKQTPHPTSINTAAQIFTEQPTGGHTEAPSLEPTNMPTDKPTMPPRITRTRPPTSAPTHPPSGNPSYNPSTSSPTIDCDLVVRPICPFLTEEECCHPMCIWDSTAQHCLFMNSTTDHEVEWMGELEVGQTHVVKAKGETRHAPRLIAHREAELLFTPSTVDDSRRLSSSETAVVFDGTLHSATEQRLESIGEVYISRENNEDVPANLEQLAKHLIDGSDTVFSVPNYIPDLDIVIDLMSLRRVNEVSMSLTENTIFSDVRIGLRFDDGRNQDESDDLVIPKTGWMWHDVRYEACVERTISNSFLSRQVRYILIRLKGGHSKSSQSWGLSGIEIVGYLDGLAEKRVPQEKNVVPVTRSFSQSTARYYTPSVSDFVRVAVYASDGRLVGVMKNVRDPSKQRDILERKLSATEIEPYSDTAWSVTIPHPWIEEGNTILIGCINQSRPLELLVHRLELLDLAQFSEHTITRTKLAIFGDKDDVAKLNHHTIEAKRLVRNLFSSMPVAELKWADTELWHLPYLVVMGPDGPALVNSEEQRRTVTGEGNEISWDVMKNFLTIRHALAQSGMGLVETSDKGSNSPYASGTSVFMGWSLSRNDGDSWYWEDLGYWDTLAAAAWTGWCAMKAGDECSNYFIHEMGHAQSMQHFNAGSAESWGISDEYPNDGVMLPSHPWGYDTVSRRFRTWFDPSDGSGKLDPLNREGEGPTSESCFSQYAPYQAKKSQEWALSTPILLSASSSHVPKDGAYQFNQEIKEYVELKGQSFIDALGESAMEPIQVGVPVVTLVGTIGVNQDVCQTYPALRSRSGNTFQFPNPFSPTLPAVFNGAAHFVEVRFEDGSSEKALVASQTDTMKEKNLEFYSFNVALERRPIAVDLYRFVGNSYPNITPQSQAQLLHIRPIDLPTNDPLDGLPPLLRVGRGRLGASHEVVLDKLCINEEDCYSDTYTFEWRSDRGNDEIFYNSNFLSSVNNAAAAATIFKVPTYQEDDSDEEYIINVLAARFYNDELGLSPLLSLNQSLHEKSDPDVTHSIRIFVPYDMNKRLPPGIYRSKPGTLLIDAKAKDEDRVLLELDVSINLSTYTASPTASPTKNTAFNGGTGSPTPAQRYHIDWMYGTCVNDGKESSWSPPYPTKSECCSAHMGAEFERCMVAEPGSPWR